MADFVAIHIQAQGHAPDAFEAGQRIVEHALVAIHEQAGADRAVQAAAGMFSGAMAMLQATLGDDRITDLFSRFLVAKGDTPTVN